MFRKVVIVNYDLAVAKPAMQIQQMESPKYDNVFICFGAFHIEMAFFGALGFFLDGSGGPTILTDTQVLAPGSLNGFLLGKHYNRYDIKIVVMKCITEYNLTFAGAKDSILC